MSKKVFELDFEGKKLIVEAGEIAKQADGAVLVRLNDTVVLSTACASDEAKDTDFFPLTVGYEEKQYAIGKIPGSFLRREGRPGEHATLTARLIDRPIRPMFSEGFRNEVQVVNTVMSVDLDSTPEMTAMFGASLALSISDIPFDGPIAGVYVGRVDGKFIINPSVEEKEKSDINLAVAGTSEAINMVEAGAAEVSEEDMLDAIMFGHEAIKKLCAFQKEIIAAVGKVKREIPLYTIDAVLQAEVEAQAKDRLVAAVSIFDKLERQNTIDDIENEVVASYDAKEDYKNEKEKAFVLKQVKEILENVVRDEVRRLITVDKVRPDGRELDEIRPSSRKYPYIDFRPAREIGNEVLTVEGISKTIDGVKVLDNVSFIVNHDDKIAFVGSNELATTTLFNIITGNMEPDEGSYKWGVTTSQAYFPKDSAAEFNREDTIVEWLTQYSPDPDPTYVRGFLGRMLFAGDDGVKKVKVLSGGEKVRCLISKMMICGANVLVFDDPTNHLDMESITALNNGLIKFPGVTLFTSHDHQFIQTTANRIMEIVPSGQLIDKITTYDEYLASDEMARKRQGFAEAASDDED